MIRILSIVAILMLATVSDAAVAIPTYDAIKTATAPVIDGDISEFSNANSITITPAVEGNVGTYKLMWDDTALYIAASVSDTQLNSVITTRDGAVYHDDSIEMMFDTLHDNATSMGLDHYKFFVNILNTQQDSQGITGGGFDAAFDSAVVLNGTNNNNADVDVGYTIEMSIPWAEMGIVGGPIDRVIGFDLVFNDKDAGGKMQTAWANTNGGSFNDPVGWGHLVLAAATQLPPPSSPTKVSIEKARLSWNWTQGTGGPASEFRFECGSVSGVYTIFYTAPAQPLNAAVKDVVGSPGKYFCVVKAANAGGKSDPSNEVFFEAVGLPIAPGDLDVSEVAQ